MNATFVIIGGGIAGVSCAKSLCFLAPEEKIVLISSSSLVKIITNIVPLGKMLLQFDVEEHESQKLLNDNPSLTIVNDTVIKINTNEKIIETENNEIIKFQKLCICTGARAHVITEENPHVIGIRDTESVEILSQRIEKSKKIIVVGNGGIATEIVYKIEKADIIWVIKDKHISATFVDPGAAEFLKNKLSKGQSIQSKENNNSCVMPKYSLMKENRKKNNITGAAVGPNWHEMFTTTRGIGDEKVSCNKVEIEYQCEIIKILTPEQVECNDDDDEWPVYAELSNGKIIGCDFIVSATGVTPNTEITGLEELKKSMDGGFLVDWKLETSCEDVYAAGDVCTANWQLAEHWFQMRLWTQAHQMGCYAAKSMLSTLRHDYFLQDFSFELFTHVTKFFGYKVILLGLYNGQKLSNDYEILLRLMKNKEYIKLVLKNGKLQGAVLIGDTDLEEMCENLILNQLDVSIYGEDLLNPDIDIEDYFD